VIAVRAALFAILLLSTACAAGGDPRLAAVSAVAPKPDVPFSATGALFGGPPDNLADHYCTASVVDTPAGDVLITAAHCVADGDGTAARTGMSFVPGYHDHLAPFGVWSVTASVIGPTWLDRGDPDQDVAFLVVHRADGVPVETLTGGYRLAVNPGLATAVTAVAIPTTPRPSS